MKRRVTIIPLDKISSRKLDHQVIDYAKQVAPGKVDLALNLIDFEDELYKAMEYILVQHLFVMILIQLKQ